MCLRGTVPPIDVDRIHAKSSVRRLISQALRLTFQFFSLLLLALQFGCLLVLLPLGSKHDLIKCFRFLSCHSAGILTSSGSISNLFIDSLDLSILISDLTCEASLVISENLHIFIELGFLTSTICSSISKAPHCWLPPC